MRIKARDHPPGAGDPECTGRRVLMMVENCSYPRDARVRAEAEALAAAGYRVSVVCPSAPGQRARESLRGVEVYRYPAPPEARGVSGYVLEYGYSMLASLALSLKVALTGGFDVIHAANPPDTFLFLGVLYKLFGKRFVYDQHDLTPELLHARFPDSRGKRRAAYSLLVLLERLSCRLADRIIAANGSYKAIEMERGRVPEDRITVVRNGPELKRLQPVEPVSIPDAEGKIILGYAGVIGYQDGVDHLLRALRHLAFDLKRSDFLCVIIGDGAALPGLKEQAHRLGIADYLLFTGWLEHSQMVRYLRTVDIGLAPEPSNSLNDRSTIVKVMDYMAAGRPIVAFDLPEHRYSARAAAMFVTPNDEAAFARAIAQLMDDPDLRRAMGGFGLRRIRTELAWEHSVPHLLQAYQRLYSNARGMQSFHP